MIVRFFFSCYKMLTVNPVKPVKHMREAHLEPQL